MSEIFFSMTTSRALPPGPVCVDIAGLELTDHERDRLRHPLTGMVILFTRNYANREQLKALCTNIHATRPEILIAVDHEGGARAALPYRIYRSSCHGRDCWARTP